MMERKSGLVHCLVGFIAFIAHFVEFITEAINQFVILVHTEQLLVHDWRLTVTQTQQMKIIWSRVYTRFALRGTSRSGGCTVGVRHFQARHV